MVNSISSSNIQAKFFEAGSSRTKFKSEIERKVYLTASIVFGVITAGLAHAAYYGIKGINYLITANNPDRKQVKTSVTPDGRIGFQGVTENPTVTSESKFKVEGKTRAQTLMLERILSRLHSASSFLTLEPAWICCRNGGILTETSNVASIAKISKEPDPPGRFYVEAENQPASYFDSFPLVVNGERLTQKNQKIYLKAGNNEIQLDDKTLFKFTLPETD